MTFFQIIKKKKNKSKQIYLHTFSHIWIQISRFSVWEILFLLLLLVFYFIQKKSNPKYPNHSDKADGKIWQNKMKNKFLDFSVRKAWNVSFSNSILGFQTWYNGKGNKQDNNEKSLIFLRHHCASRKCFSLICCTDQEQGCIVEKGTFWSFFF